MPHLIYDRLDVILSALMIISLALLLQQSRLLSFFMFALAVNFKLIPFFLAPVWILGSFRASDFFHPDRRDRFFGLLRTGATRCLTVGGMIVGVFMLFLYKEGNGVFGFLAYHADRGVHIESSWGTFSLLAARLTGTSFRVIHEYGAYDVAASSTHFLQMASMALLVVAFCAPAVLLTLSIVRRLRGPVSGTRPVLSPQSVLAASLWCLCNVLSFSKVFSPHFLFLLVPFAALVPLRDHGKFVLYLALAAVCFISSVIYPCCYMSDIIAGPSRFGLFLLVARMSLLIGVTGFLTVRVVDFPGRGRGRCPEDKNAGEGTLP